MRRCHHDRAGSGFGGRLRAVECPGESGGCVHAATECCSSRCADGCSRTGPSAARGARRTGPGATCGAGHADAFAARRCRCTRPSTGCGHPARAHRTAGAACCRDTDANAASGIGIGGAFELAGSVGWGDDHSSGAGSIAADATGASRVCAARRAGDFAVRTCEPFPLRYPPRCSVRAPALCGARAAGGGTTSGAGKLRSSPARDRSAVYAVRATSGGCRRACCAAPGSCAVRRRSAPPVHSAERSGFSAAVRHASRRRRSPAGAQSGDAGHSRASAGRAPGDGDSHSGRPRRTAIAPGHAGEHATDSWRGDARQASDQSLPGERSQREGQAAGPGARVGHRRLLPAEA